MGFKEKMMDNMMNKFFGKMKPEEKQAMMTEMMDKFFGKMTPEEKQDMMKNMMPKMMMGMMEGGAMKDMMKNMMSGMHGKMCGKGEGEAKNSGHSGFNHMEMCMRMMSGIGKSNELASYATPEVRALFEEWAEQIEGEILKYIKETNTTDQAKIAEHFKLSRNSINFFLAKLAEKGKIDLEIKEKE